MALHPLTHHEILALVEPFARSGRQVDLAASDRAERRLVFKPIDHAGDAEGAVALREVLQLDEPSTGTFRLTRTLTLAGGLQATLHTEGRQPGELLDRVAGVPLQRQFRSQPGFVIAESHRIEAAKDGATTAAPLILTQAVAQVDALTLSMTLPSLGGIPAEIEIKPTAGDRYELPEDLLAVLGWSWARLIRVGTGWKCSLRLRGSAARRSRDAEAKLERTAAHLAQTLAEPPSRFHERWNAMRWRVTVRRGVPLVVTAGLIGIAAAVPSMGLSENSLLRMVIFQSPPLLLGLVFCLRELPTIEVPPWPRPPAQPTWRTAPDLVTAPSGAVLP